MSIKTDNTIPYKMNYMEYNYRKEVRNIIYEDFFAKRLATLRTEKGVSARDMSLSIGQSESYINKIENGKAFPSMQIFFYICEYLKITPKEFFDDDIVYSAAMVEVVQDLSKLKKEQFENVTAIIKGLTK